MRALTTICASLLGFAAAGCFTAELDPNRTGVFLCSTEDDCPAGGQCINMRCEMDAPPTVEVNVELTFPHGSRPGGTGEHERTPIAFDMTVRNLVLRDPKMHPDHVFGEGHIEIVLDGDPIHTIPGNEPEDFISVLNTPGAHRLRATILRNDGIAYDHTGSSVKHLFWFDDGEPHVAIVSPWSGEEIPAVNSGRIIVEIETLNFEISNRLTGERAPNFGHGHVHYEPKRDLSMCFDPPPPGGQFACNEGYRGGFIGPLPGVCSFSESSACQVLDNGFPDAPEGEAELWVTLRHVDHQPYYHPFGSGEGGDDTGGTDTDGMDDTSGDTDDPPEDDDRRLVLDHIEIVRVSAPAG